jgi:cytochrome P450
MSREASRAIPLSFEPGENGAPPPIFEGGEATCPVILPGSGEEVLVLTSRATVIAALSGPDFGVAPLEDKHAVTGAVCQRNNGMLRLDKPRITDIRRSIGPFFSEKHIEQWRPGIECEGAALVAEMATGPLGVDLITAFSDPFVAKASSLTAGIPSEDWPRLRELSDATLALIETSEDIHGVRQAWDDLYSYCTNFVARGPEKNQGNNILRDVIATFEQQGMSTNDLVPAFATIINGFPTPGPVLNVCVLELLKRPEAVETCLNDPSLWSPTVDELMRYRAHFAATLPRVALRDVTLEGVFIPKGQAVIPSLRAAAHDPARTEDPKTFNIEQKASRSIVFGSGSHLCPGATLTRQWLQVALKELFTALK